MYLPNIPHFWATVNAFLDRTKDNYEERAASESEKSTKTTIAHDIDTATLICTSTPADQRLICRYPRDSLGESRVYKWSGSGGKLSEEFSAGKDETSISAFLGENSWARDEEAENRLKVRNPQKGFAPLCADRREMCGCGVLADTDGTGPDPC